MRVGVAVGVLVEVNVGVAVGVAVLVTEGVNVGVAVSVGVGAGVLNQPPRLVALAMTPIAVSRIIPSRM